MSVRALATGDNHLGSGADLGRVPGERLAEQEQVWRRTLELAREYECDVVLHGGDLFHRASPSPEEVLAALRPLVEHGEAGGCPVIMALGNHERRGVSEATMPAAISELDVLIVEQSPAHHWFSWPEGGVTVCSLPWISAGRLVADAGGGDRDRLNEHAAELLIEAAWRLRGAVEEGPAILLTHFSITGSSLPNGLPVDQLREPVLELGALERIGFDAVVAGHIHKGQIMGRDDVPVFYVGSPMPLNFGEAGYDHGCFLLESSGLHGLLAPRFVPIDSRRLVTVDLTGAQAIEIAAAEWLPSIDVRDAVVKIRLHATQDEAKRIVVPAIKREAEVTGGAHKVFVELDVDRQERARVEGMSEELGEMEALALWLDSVGINGTKAQELHRRTEQYLEVVR